LLALNPKIRFKMPFKIMYAPTTVIIFFPFSIENASLNQNKGQLFSHPDVIPFSELML